MRLTLWKQILIYGAVLALGSLALQWLDFQSTIRTHGRDYFVLLIGAVFLAIGVYIGLRVIARPLPAPPAGNPQAVEQLGITPAELAVLVQLAAGRSNKEIAQQLAVSPNTVKTHLARLFQKLEARRRTDAIQRARELGILS